MLVSSQVEHSRYQLEYGGHCDAFWFAGLLCANLLAASIVFHKGLNGQMNSLMGRLGKVSALQSFCMS